MLQLLIGRSGSGKTTHLLKQMATNINNGEKTLLWLVPEQHSFESERLLLNHLGARDAARVQVCSFTRLAELVFREVGGVAKAPLDEGVRALLMSRALEQVAALQTDLGQPLQGLRPGRATDSTYVEQLLSLWEELRQCAVPTDALEQVAQELEYTAPESPTLPEKARSLHQVFTVYEGLAAASGADELEALTRLAEYLPDSQLPEGAVVFIDGFKGFTTQELAVLDRLIPRVKEMTIALCSDTPGARFPGVNRADCKREYTLFSPVTDTVEQLRRLGENHGQRWQLLELKENHRTTCGGLLALEAGLYAPAPAVYGQPAPEVTLVPCEQVYEECTAAVHHIRRLLREEGYRCRDITVVVRDLSAYAGLLDAALEQEGIPCYMDTRTDLLCEPLVVYVRAALRLAVGGWRTEDLLRLLKTDLTALSPVEIAELENYAYMWRIDGSAWDRDWSENPAGMGVPFTAAGRETLARLNARRNEILLPLRQLRKNLRGAVNGRQFALAVYEWLTADRDLPQRIAEKAACLETLAQPVLAAHAARLWDEVIGVLDRFSLALGDAPLPAARMEELFAMLCRMVDMGHIPQGLDAVTIGQADRIRYNNPRAVFILGANEGVFPAYPSASGLLTEEERQTLRQHGVQLSADLLRQCVEERYYVYTAVAAPRERLMVTYQTGGEAAPSPLVAAIRQILPQHTQKPARQPDGRDPETYREAFEQMAESYLHPTTVTPSLQQLIAENPLYAPRLAAVERAAQQAPLRMEDPSVTRALFGTDLCLSASQTEAFYSCPFSYFCRYGLRVQPRRIAQIDGAVFGTLVHHVMETLLPEYTVENGLVSQLRQSDASAQPTADRQWVTAMQQEVHRVIGQYLEQTMGGTEEKSGRFLYQVGLAERAACNMLWHTVIELAQSAFDPVDFEVAICPEEEADPDSVLSLRLPFAGGTVQVRGQVDRVDLFIRSDGSAFVRVVDYKTGTKVFDLCELTAGLSMQMLLYLFILCDNSRRYLEREGELRPAGVLYHPLSDLTIKRGEDPTRRLRSMRMSGLVLEDPSVVLAMEKEGQEHFIPAKLDKGGKVKGSTVTPQQFTLLRGVIERLLTSMAERLLAGDIEAMPLQRGEHSPCVYCDYAAVCGRDGDAPTRLLEKKNRQTVLDELAAEEEVPAHGQT